MNFIYIKYLTLLVTLKSKYCTLQYIIYIQNLLRLYNKEAVVEQLLRRKRETSMDPSADPLPHVKSLRDVRELKLTPRQQNSTAAKSSESGSKVSQGSSIADMTAQFICPISGLEMNGIYPYARNPMWSSIVKCPTSTRRGEYILCLFNRFVFLWGCGCVLSKRALFALSSDAINRAKETDDTPRSLPANCPNVHTVYCLK